ncbi:hypothetical protein ODB14_004004 [Salmonella enterica]|nr:hypothetical protein [Salmonella enterica]EGA1331321.1 hypothetical protein [Salmonella enterica]EGB6732059.1 hypothetical protein [Salmonella enterica]EGI1467592.1 hypothetical protein [Salmonella enterica]EGN8737755.1 hypothetical protein [Salmonella enterica]
MPVVPTVTGRQVESRGVQTGGFQAVAQPNISDALVNVGSQALDVFGQAKQRANVALSQEALLQFNQYADDQINSTNDGLITRQGKNALGQSDVVMKNMQQKAQDLLGTIPEGEARQQLARQLTQSMQSYQNQARRYEVGQFQQFQYQAFSSGNSLAIAQSTSLYGDNQSFINLAQQRFEAVDQYADAHGLPDEWRVQQKTQLKEQMGQSAWAGNIAQKYSELLQTNGEPGDLNGVSRVFAHGNSSSARGLRNNNPGNIEASQSNPWEGQIGSDGRFATFATPEHGIRALGKNLLSYQRQGYDTVSEIVNRWAPAKDGNNTDAYIQALCGALGVGAYDPLDVSNPKTLAALCAGIVKHENGSVPYSDEQLDIGVSAALGLTNLESPKRYTGNAAFDAMSPQMQVQALRQANELNNQYRQQYAEQLSMMVKDAYSALDEGLRPTRLPTEADFIRANGPRIGAMKWQEMQAQIQYGGVIGAAKDLTPEGRQDILERLRPQDPDAPGFAANQQRWEKMQGKFKEMDKEWEIQQGRNRFVSSMQNNFPLDPNDKNNQAAVDRYFAQDIAPSFSISDPQSINALATVTTKSGMIPTQVKDMLKSGATSRDPALVVPMAKFYGQLFDNNPAAATTLDKGTMAFYGKVYDYSRAGVPEDKAVDMAYSQVFQQDERMKKMLDTAMRDKGYVSARDKAAQSNASSLTSFGSWSPDITDPGKSNVLYQRDYQTIYDANFAQTGGDADQAEKMTNAMIRTTWGVSTVNGKAEVMKYAPEALYGVSNGAGNWIQGQWEQEKRELKSKSFGGPRSDTDLILVPDGITARDKSYAVMVLQPDENGTVEPRNYLGENGLPVRFRPEQQTSPMYKQIMQYQQQRIDEARMNREGNPSPQFSNNEGYTPPDLTKPFGYGSANNLPSNIYAGGK